MRQEIWFSPTLEALTASLKEQTAQIQKVSAQLEASKPAPQVVKPPDKVFSFAYFLVISSGRLWRLELKSYPFRDMTDRRQFGQDREDK
jgi:hypothetical protein